LGHVATLAGEGTVVTRRVVVPAEALGLRDAAPRWVLTLPHRLRYALAWDHRLCRAVLGVFVRALLGVETRRAAPGRFRILGT